MLQLGEFSKVFYYTAYNCLFSTTFIDILFLVLIRRRRRRKREKKLLENMEDESHEGFEQNQFSSYPGYDEPYYENITMDEVLGPLPPTPADGPPPPPPPPPPPGGKSKSAKKAGKTASQSSFYSDDEY